TGTSLWIVPDRDVFVLLLTNRAYNPRVRNSFTRLKEDRGRVADAAARAADAPVHCSLRADVDLRRRMRHLPQGGGVGAPLGLGTCAPPCTVPGRGCRRALPNRAAGARRCHASRVTGRPRVCRG